MGGMKYLDNALFLLNIVPFFLDLASYMKYNYYVSCVNRKGFV